MAFAESALAVLVVDDESATRMMTRALLQRRGYRVSEAEDGAAAVFAVSAAEPPFDVILLDVQMPGLDGTGALAALRGLDDPARAGAAIIMLTARADAGLEADLMALGADAVMVKPLRWDVLEPVLAGCLSTAAGSGSRGDAGTAMEIEPLPTDTLSPIERMLADLPFDKVRHLLERAAVNLREHHDGLRSAAEMGRRPEVERLAHKIVGVAGTYGCDRLRAAALSLEQEALRLDVVALPERVALLDAPFAEGLALLDRYRQGK